MHGIRRRLATGLAALWLALGCAQADAWSPDSGGRTPVARPGTPLAATRALDSSGLRSKINSALAGVGGATGVWVRDMDAHGAGLLFTHDAGARRTPASNEKLFTTAAFLDALGSDATLKTRVFPRGAVGQSGILSGDLVIVGDGDPAFGTARFAHAHDQPVTRLSALARKIAQAGVTAIKGRVLADDTIFDRDRYASADVSPLSGLSFNDGYDDGHYSHAPELVAARALKQSLRKLGVDVAGRVGHADLGRKTLETRPLAQIASPTIAKLIEETNVPSNNFFAEMLLKRLAAEGGKVGTRKRGVRKVESFAESLGTDVHAYDGSGLSRSNGVTAEEVGKLLVAMASLNDEDEAAAFTGSLPIAGKEGTVADRMRGTAAEGNCETKTGTLSDASALSGYCKAGPHTIAFSILMNSVNVDAARKAQDRIAAAIARYRP
ncbi:MAG: D-alanyl-D-alanine carboxypeptidase/D-alanyl-D-alanine-endopeptidase [Solirubrobacterales bacterium]